MPKFGSKIDVAGKVFDLKRQNVATKNDMLALIVPRGYKTFCDELNAWYEYMGDDYDVDEITGRWRKESNDDVKVHVVKDLPPKTISTDWIQVYPGGSDVLPEEAFLSEIPENTINESEAESQLPEDFSSYTRKQRYFIIINNSAYPISHFVKYSEEEISGSENEDNEEEIEPIIENEIYIFHDEENPIEVVSDPNDATSYEFFVRPGNDSNVAKNGHVYLVEKSGNAKIWWKYNTHEDRFYNANVKVISEEDLSQYTVYVPQNPGGNPGVSPGGIIVDEIVYPDDYVFDLIIVHNEDDDEYNVYQKRDTVLYPLDCDVVDSESDYQGDNKYVILPQIDNKDLYDEYLFINGKYELLGTNYEINIQDIKNSLANIISTLDSRINYHMASFDNYPDNLKFANGCVYFDLGDGYAEKYYFNYTNKVVTANGYTKLKKTVDVYNIDDSQLQYISLDSTDNQYRSLVCFDHPENSDSTTIDVYTKTEYNSPIGDTDRIFATTYTKLYEIRNIDKVNECFDIYLVYDSEETLMEEAVPFSAVTHDRETDLAKYVKGRTTDSVVEHNPSEIVKQAFGDNPTQKSINEQLALGALLMDKVFEDYGWIEDILDSRDDDSISKKIVPISLNVSDFNKCDGFVIEDAVFGLKSTATEVTFTRPVFSDIFNDTPTATTWCYIGSAELFTGTSDDIDYTFAWNKSNPAEAIIWRSTEIPATDSNDDVTSENHVKLRGYKICDNLAGQIIKSLLNAQNS